MTINDSPRDLALNGGKEKDQQPWEAQQYQSLKEGGLIDPDKDLYAEETGTYSRPANLQDNSEVRVLIIGAGIHGLTTAYRLVKDAGLKTEDVVNIDKAGGWGGTWYWNRYPGVMCDVEGYSYLPLLEESCHIPAQRYPPGYEIRSHMARTAEEAGLTADFGVTVSHLRWDESDGRWHVTLSRTLPDQKQSEPFTVKAQYVSFSTGLLPTPLIPKIPGFTSLRDAPGKIVMHTARWDWNVSGGSPQKPDMVNFQGKRVGIIGTGPTAVQAVPHLAKWAKELLVFQRNPEHVGTHYQEETTREGWEKIAYKKGWHLERMLNLDSLYAETAGRVDRVQDGWSEIPGLRAMTGTPLDTMNPGEEATTVQKLLAQDYEWAAKMRHRVAREVDDPVVAESLQCHGPSFCKRPAFHNSYPSIFNEPNVTLVDTRGKGVVGFTEKGVVANEQVHEVDVLILATGYSGAVFDSTPPGAIKASITGKNGRSLKEKWNGDDFGVWFGLTTNEFPNLFFFTPAGSGMSMNLNASLHTNAGAIATIIQRAQEQASDPSSVVLEISKEAEREYTEANTKKARWFSGVASCVPGLSVQHDGSGVDVRTLSDEELKRNPWGGGLMDFRERFAAWVQTGRLEGFTTSEWETSTAVHRIR